MKRWRIISIIRRRVARFADSEMSGKLEDADGIPLAKLGIGRIARISAITPTETHLRLPARTWPATRHHCQNHRHRPLDGPLTLLVDESDTVMLGQNVAQLVLVVPFSAESEPAAPIETTLDRLPRSHRHHPARRRQRRIAPTLLEMGLTVGAEIKTERVAPLGDPIEYRIKGTAFPAPQRCP